MPFRVALSGLNAATTDLEVTGNNIANAATTGFKQSRTEFGDLFASSVQDSANTAGQGVRVSRIAQQFSQGSVDFTSSNLDLAISGEGFFVVEANDGTLAYTRAGAFSVDRDGYVVSAANDRLQTYSAVDPDADPVVFNTSTTGSLRLPTLPSSPESTDTIEASLNLDASSSTPTNWTSSADFDPTDPTTYNSSTSTTVYDSLGNAHTAQMYFTKTGNGRDWEFYTIVNGTDVTPTSNTLQFSTAGELTSPTTSVALSTYGSSVGAADLDMQLDFTGTTQFGSAFAVNNLSQDGFTSGRLTGVDIDKDGIVFARFTNGQSTALGKVALAKFYNPQGLRQLGDTTWGETYQSGVPQTGEAGTSSFGQIQSGALEASNVDIAEQLVNLITAQRNFQANSEVISTSDTITQTIINIR